MSIFDVTFARPWLLAVGGALSLVVTTGIWLHARRRRKLADFLGGRRASGRLSRSDLYRLPVERMTLLTVAVMALAAAAAGPSLPEEPPPPEEPVAEVVLALDVSMSMQADDTEPNRLGRAVATARELLDRMEEHRVGLLLYSGTPYPLAPPTADHEAVRFLMSGIDPDLQTIYDPGSLPSAAIREAMALLDYDSRTDTEPDSVITEPAAAPPPVSTPRSIVLLSDGESGEPMDELLTAVSEADGAGVTVHAIGVGTAEGGGFRPPVGYRPRSIPASQWGSIVTRFREDDLVAITDAGGGTYAYVDDDAALSELIEEVGGEGPDTEPIADPSPWLDLDPTSLLIALAFLALLGEGLLDIRLPGRLTVPRPRRAP